MNFLRLKTNKNIKISDIKVDLSSKLSNELRNDENKIHIINHILNKDFIISKKRGPSRSSILAKY